MVLKKHHPLLFKQHPDISYICHKLVIIVHTITWKVDSGQLQWKNYWDLSWLLIFHHLWGVASHLRFCSLKERHPKNLAKSVTTVGFAVFPKDAGHGCCLLQHLFFLKQKNHS